MLSVSGRDGVARRAAGPERRVGVRRAPGTGSASSARTASARPPCCGASPGTVPPDARRGRARARASLTVGFLPQETDAAPGRDAARRTSPAAPASPAASAELDRLTDALETDPGLGRGVHRRARPVPRARRRRSRRAHRRGVRRPRRSPADRLDVEVAVALRRAGRPRRARGDPAQPVRRPAARRAHEQPRLRRSRSARAVRAPRRPARWSSSPTTGRSSTRPSTGCSSCRRRRRRAVEYAGSWSDYVAARDLARSQQYARYDEFRAKRRALLERARTQKVVVRAGRAQRSSAAARTTRTSGSARPSAARSRRRRRRSPSGRWSGSRLVEKPWEGWELRLQLAPSARSGDVVVRLERGGGAPRDVRARPDRPRDRVAGADRDPRPERQRQDHVAAGAARRDPARPRAGAGSGPGVQVGEMDQSRAQLPGGPAR